MILHQLEMFTPPPPPPIPAWKPEISERHSPLLDNNIVRSRLIGHNKWGELVYETTEGLRSRNVEKYNPCEVTIWENRNTREEAFWCHDELTINGHPNIQHFIHTFSALRMGESKYYQALWMRIIDVYNTAKLGPIKTPPPRLVRVHPSKPGVSWIIYLPLEEWTATERNNLDPELMTKAIHPDYGLAFIRKDLAGRYSIKDIDPKYRLRFTEKA